ncbi:hypothetical protein D9M68_938120 [compost metagenome]
MLVEVPDEQDVDMGRHEGEEQVEVMTGEVLDFINKKLVVESLDSGNDPGHGFLDLQELCQSVVV